MSDKTKGQIEAQISSWITSFEKEQLGRGPTEVRTFIIQDIILIRIKGVLTPAEKNLAKEIDGARLVKQVRERLIEGSRKIIEGSIEKIVGSKITSLQSDISTDTGDRFIVCTCNSDLEERLRKKLAEKQ
jgi:uncharacterized protein YbcI